jgi:hypothetical protein
MLDFLEIKGRGNMSCNFEAAGKRWMLHEGYCRQKKRNVPSSEEESSLDVVRSAV